MKLRFPVGAAGVPSSASHCHPPCSLPPAQALGKLQFLYLADNLLDSIPGPLPLSLCALHLQVRSPTQSWETGSYCPSPISSCSFC